MNFSRVTTTFILLLAGFDLTAQLVSVEELQGIDSVYIKEHNKGAIYGTESYSIRNKNATFKEVESYYLEYSELRGRYPVIEVSSKEELDVYVKVFFAPFFKDVEGEELNRKLLAVSLFSDIEGALTDIRIGGIKDITLPVSAVELFHKAIRRGNLRLIFNSSTKAFVNSPWVGRSYYYSYSTLKEMAKEH
ncbi:MAG TPA: hypothetical protein VKY45_09265 [Marinilabiliaceae bacterium]|nr:hypothetical protein [Marinilabiliaceae bacterium]